MGEGLGTDRATLHSLDVVIAGGSGLHARGDLGVVNDLPLCSTVGAAVCYSPGIDAETSV